LFLQLMSSDRGELSRRWTEALRRRARGAMDFLGLVRQGKLSPRAIVPPALVLLGCLILIYVGWQYFAMYREQRALEQAWTEQQQAAPSLAHTAAASPGLTRITIPKIKLDSVVAEGTSNRALRSGPGHLRGSAPLNVQLNAGPHTIRVSRHGEDSPVKLVSMPGDQMQTLTFQLGAANDVPRLSLLNHEPPAMLDRVAAVVVYVDRVSDDDVEMWLNLRENGEWHNFPMALQAAPGGTVGVAVIPADRLRPPKAAPFYVSAKRKATGEEYYSEMQNPGTL